MSLWGAFSSDSVQETPKVRKPDPAFPNLVTLKPQMLLTWHPRLPVPFSNALGMLTDVQAWGGVLIASCNSGNLAKFHIKDGKIFTHLNMFFNMKCQPNYSLSWLPTKLCSDIHAVLTYCFAAEYTD